MTHKCLGRYGYQLKQSELTLEQIKKIKTELNVTPKVLAAYSPVKPASYKIYYMDKENFYVPRFWGIENFGEPDYVALSKGLPMSCKVTCPNEPLKHQVEAFKKLNVIFKAGKQLGDGGVLSLPCGYGKTFCAIKTACSLKLKTLIVVPTECLMDQWAEAIGTFAPGAKVGSIQRDKIIIEDCDFVICMLHSICLKDYSYKIFDQFGLSIYDECHHIASETFSKSVMKIRTLYILGLSATPNRKDGLSHVFYKFMGPLFHKERRAGSNQIIVKKLNCYSQGENYKVLYQPSGVKNTQGMTTELAKMHERNLLIIEVLKELTRQGRKILLLSARKQHLHDIKDLLDLKALINHKTGEKITYGLYYGKQGMNRATHKALLRESAKSDIVLGIEIIAKEGLDIPDRNTLVWATPPGTDIEQPVGRILRKYHKDINPMVIDIVDNTGNFKKHSSERDKWFLEEDYIIHDHTIEMDLKEEEITTDTVFPWLPELSEYINKMMMVCKAKKSKQTIKQEESEKGPDNLVCLVNDEDGEELKPDPVKKPVKKLVFAKPKPFPKEGIKNDICYLGYSSPAIGSNDLKGLKDVKDLKDVKIDISICLI